MILRQQPREAAYMRAVEPEAAQWGLQEHLLAAIADACNARVWQSGKQRMADRPKPIPRPGVEAEKKTVHKHDILPVSDMAAWLGGDFAAMAA